MKYDPKYISGNGLPTDRATVNAWCRSFALLEPIVNETIEFYSTYPCKFLQIKHHRQKEIKRFFEYQFDKLSLMEKIPEIVKQYWTLGECFVYSELDEQLKMWRRLMIQNPDYIIVKRSIIADDSDSLEISLRPDEKLRTLVLKENPSDNEKKELDRLDKKIIESVKNGENIPLNNFYTSAFIRRQSPYETRGTSPLIPVFKKLAILGKVRTIGKEWNHILSDQHQLEQEIKEALGHPDVLIKNDGAIRKDVAKTRMMQTMAMMSQWAERKMFSPIAKINDFYEYKNAKKELAIPKIVFDSKKFSAAFDRDCSQISAST